MIKILQVYESVSQVTTHIPTAHSLSYGSFHKKLMHLFLSCEF